MPTTSSATTITETETIANLRLFFISKLYQIYADYAIFFYKITDRRSPPAGQRTYSRKLRCAAKDSVRNYAYSLSMLDETGFYAPSMAHNALPSRPWLGISVFHGIISTVSKPLRYSLTGSMCATTADGDLRYLLFAKTQVLYCGFGI